MIDTLIVAATLGFFGSLHCAVMCGPLASAGCTRRAESVGYVAGRAVAYVLGGAVFGAIGMVSHQTQRLQTIGAWLVAAFFILYGLRHLRRRTTLVSLPTRRSVTRLLPRRGLGLGLVTGVLPCGLLFGAWAVAATTGHPVHGALVMFVFSLVTLPALLAPTLLRPVVRRIRVPTAVAGAAWCALGVWVAVRPYLDHHHGGH